MKMDEFYSLFGKLYGARWDMCEVADGLADAEKTSLNVCTELNTLCGGDWRGILRNRVIGRIENLLISSDTQGRKIVLRRALRYVNLDYLQEPELWGACDEKRTRLGVYYGFAVSVELVLAGIVADLTTLCADCDLQIGDVTSDEIPAWIYDAAAVPSFEDVGDDRRKGDYKPLPRTYRITAVNQLIAKAGLCKDIDKTKIAEFVEAVTGGNPNAKGKDTVSYKNPEKKAETAAKDLLTKIGL